MKTEKSIVAEQSAGEEEAKAARYFQRDNADFEAGWNAALAWVMKEEEKKP